MTGLRGRGAVAASAVPCFDFLAVGGKSAGDGSVAGRQQRNLVPGLTG